MSDKEKRTRKYMQDQRHKKRLERAAKTFSHHYYAPAFWIDEKYLGNGECEKIKKPYARKIYKSAGCARYRYYKKHSNRQVRRSKCAIPKGNWYRKIFDYAWEVD